MDGPQAGERDVGPASVPSQRTAPAGPGLLRSAALDALVEMAAGQAAERERERLARDLHDSVSPALFSVHARAQAVTRALAAGDRETLAAAARDLEAVSQQAIDELRVLLSELRPRVLDTTFRLADALAQLAATTTERNGLAVRQRMCDTVRPLPAAAGEHLYRIAVEALHNTVKHAGATGAVLELGLDGDHLVLAVSDDGRGFNPAAAAAVADAGHGQRTMRERAVLCGGGLSVRSAPGRGTRVEARIPLPGE